MTTIQALHEDVFYTILPHCSSSIDMWNLLLALNSTPDQISNLRAFWSRILLTSRSSNEEQILDFVKQIAMFTVELRLDHLNWINTANLRRILSFFRILVNFHTGNVALSKRTLIHDVSQLFPFLKSFHCLVCLTENSDDEFVQICSSLASMKQLNRISLLLEDEKKICLSTRSAQQFSRSFFDRLVTFGSAVRHIAIEENSFDFDQRFNSNAEQNLSLSIRIRLDLASNWKSFIWNFRSMSKFNLLFDNPKSNNIEILVVPKFDENFSVEKLKLLHVGCFDPKSSSGHWLRESLRSSLRNVTLQLNEWTPVDFLIETDRDEFILKFSSICQFEIPTKFFRQLTNLNLTGVHFHSTDFPKLINELEMLRSLSLSPCLFSSLDQNQNEIFKLKRNLFALNLVSNEKNLKEFCPILREQTSRCLNYEQIIKTSIRIAFLQLDLHHFSVRCPNYQIQREDFSLPIENHLETLILDVKIPVSFHAILAEQFALKRLENLRRFCLFTIDDFQLTELLFDRFSSMETIEIVSFQTNFRRSIIKYIERVLLPSTYPNLNEFSFRFARVDAQHLLKQLNKTIHSRFAKIRPGLQFSVGLVSAEHKLILYDHKHPIHQSFHVVPNRYSRQLSLSFPSFLNYFPLYNELNFDN